MIIYTIKLRMIDNLHKQVLQKDFILKTTRYCVIKTKIQMLIV